MEPIDTPTLNIIAQRYASSGIRYIWSPHHRVLLERRWWIAVLKAQKKLGVEIPDKAIEAYEKVAEQIDLAAIQAREEETQHDLKARIDVFCKLAGYQYIHQGLTSRDVTDNVEQLLILQSLDYILEKCTAVIHLLKKHIIDEHQTLLVARTHNVPAQLTTLGRRLATYLEEWSYCVSNVHNFRKTYVLRGIKGAIGTQQDLFMLFNHDFKKVIEFEEAVLGEFGVQRTLHCTSQVYPRSFDFDLIAKLYQLSCPANSFATTMRLMAGQALMMEKFEEGQTGSSAMPHKMNPRMNERLNSLCGLMSGYLQMSTAVAGHQWNEGDVACSVSRRVVLPDSFYTIDAILEVWMHVLENIQFIHPNMQLEVQSFTPLLLTSSFLTMLVKKGMPREEAHEQIKQTIQELTKNAGVTKPTFPDLVAVLHEKVQKYCTLQDLQEICDQSLKVINVIDNQIGILLKQCEILEKLYPNAASIKSSIKV